MPISIAPPTPSQRLLPLGTETRTHSTSRLAVIRREYGRINPVTDTDGVADLDRRQCASAPRVLRVMRTSCVVPKAASGK